MAGLTRREFGGVVAAGLVVGPLATAGARQKPDSRIAGVRIGAQSYSFRDRSLDATVEAMEVDPFAQKAGISVAFHNHSNIRPNEFATPQERRWKGMTE